MIYFLEYCNFEIKKKLQFWSLNYQIGILCAGHKCAYKGQLASRGPYVLRDCNRGSRLSYSPKNCKYYIINLAKQPPFQNLVNLFSYMF